MSIMDVLSWLPDNYPLHFTKIAGEDSNGTYYKHRTFDMNKERFKNREFINPAEPLRILLMDSDTNGILDYLRYKSTLKITEFDFEADNCVRCIGMSRNTIEVEFQAPFEAHLEKIKTMWPEFEQLLLDGRRYNKCFLVYEHKTIKAVFPDIADGSEFSNGEFSEILDLLLATA